MKELKLDDFKNAVSDEIKRRNKINELQKEKLVIEYLQIANISPLMLDSSDIRNIVKYILGNYYISNSSKKLYLCIDAQNENCNVEIDNPSAIAKYYRDIESTYSFEEAVKEGFEDPYKYGYYDTCSFDRPYIDYFENEHIVLNPYNNRQDNEETFDNIRLDYFEYLIQCENQEKAIEKMLEKYPRI